MSEVMAKFPCLLLAGGQSRRMGGGTKFLRELGGQTLLARIVETLHPQVGKMVLNMNADIPKDAVPDLPILQDSVSGFAGALCRPGTSGCRVMADFSYLGFTQGADGRKFTENSGVCGSL